MKKLIALFLSLMMALSLCAGALAEGEQITEADVEALVPAPEEIPVDFPEATLEAGLGIDVIDEVTPDKDVTFAANGMDTVTVSNGVVTVNNGVMTIIFKQGTNSAYLCCTQDYIASLTDFFRLYDDPAAAAQNFIEKNVHLFIFDAMTHDYMYFKSFGADRATQMVGNLTSSLNSSMLESFANVICMVNGLTLNEILTIGDNAWLRCNDNIYLTVRNNAYLAGYYIASETFTAEEQELAADILDRITLK